MKPIATYNLYYQPTAVNPESTVIMLREGFCVWAFVFGVFWAAYHGLWQLVAILIGLFFLLGAAEMQGGFPPLYLQIIQASISLWLGLDAIHWRIKKLTKAGYQLYDMAMASNEKEALLRITSRMV